MEVESLLRKIKNEIGNVLPFDLNKEKITIFDFSANNPEVSKISDIFSHEFSDYVKKIMNKNGAKVGIGKYNEDRVIYQSGLFTSNEESRTIHLGIDLFSELGTNVYSPLDGRIHSFQNNAAKGDYGPTIILEHNIMGTRFFTLYGHLSLDSLDGKKIGQKVSKGEAIGKIGKHEINGNWPPHVHFEIIADMMDKKGDFPGVAKKSEREKWLKICPDPNLILRISKLE